MAKIYGTPIMAGGAGGANKDLPPLLDNFKAFKGGGTSENPHITIQADKMVTSRANELAGAVWVYGDHIPKNVNDGTKIQLTREEITRPDVDPYVTLADIPASDAETETIVNLKESDGKLHPYLYLSNNYENSNGCLLLRKECYMKGAWSNTQGANNNLFPEHELDIWCYQTFPDYLDSSIKSELISVSIKVNGKIIQRQCFPLSCTEYGTYGTSGDFPTEGSSLSYFSTNEKRIALFENNATNYWTRTTSPKNQRTGYFIRSTGDSSTNVGSAMMGYRPAFCLPLTFKLKGIKNEDGSYDMYEDTSTVSSFVSSEFTVQKSVSWEQTKNFFARQFTFNPKKQYQTMREGAVAKIYSGKSITELPSGSKVKLGTWNDTPLQWKVARDTSDQSLRLVLEPNSVSLLGSKSYDVAEPGNSDSNRKLYGNNRYIYSNIHQWLNATEISSWYTAQHSADAPPKYESSPGFLSGWSETELSALDEATLTTTKASVDGSGTETFVARVALISTTELGLESSTGGGRLDIFNSNGDRAINAIYWTRTPNPDTPDYAYSVDTRGALDSGRTAVRSAYRVRPLCIPKSTTYVSLQPDSDGCYTITGVNE